MKQSLKLVLVSATLVWSISAQSPLKPCNVSGTDEQLLCGKLSVFENRQTLTGRKIDLNVVVLPALEPDHKEAPLFALEGGPGVAATTGVEFYSRELRSYRQHRDVVLVDQRGTGESNPLHCDGTGKKHLDEMYPVRYVEDCRQRLERVADLTQYTTPIAMDDLDDVRAWLGYDRINLIGLSYGTRAALVYMRQHPQRVRSVVLIGVAPTNAKLPMYHTKNGQRAIDLMFGICASDADCAKAYPNIGTEFTRVLETLERRPAKMKYKTMMSADEIEVEIHRDQFAEELRTQLYSPSSARRLPFIIHQAAAGDFTPFLKLAMPSDPSQKISNFIADGMYLSITCAEDVPYINQSEAARMNKGTFFGNYRVEQQVRACSLWPRGNLPAGYDQPTTAQVPVLIITGFMDPVTSPDWASEVGAHLTNSKNWIIRQQAHGPFGLSHPECVDNVIIKFLEKLDLKKLDTSCGEQMLAPAFFIEHP